MLKRINIIYIFALLLAIIAIPLLHNELYNLREFYGIAENPVRTMNLDYPVEISHILKRQGESIRKGDTILLLRRLDLKSRTANLEYEILENDLRNKIDHAQLLNEIEQLEKEKLDATSQFQFKSNAELYKITQAEKLIHIVNEKDTGFSKSHPIYNSYNSLHDEYQRSLADLNLKILSKKKEAVRIQESYALKQRKLENEMHDLGLSTSELTIISPEDGMVGELDFAEKDRVPSFTPLVRIYGLHPNIVIMYISDQQLTKFQVGNMVTIRPISNPSYKIQGIINALGTRITSLPERLKKIPEARVWGREIQIKIPDENPFLQGEKVSVSLQ